MSDGLAIKASLSDNSELREEECDAPVGLVRIGHLRDVPSSNANPPPKTSAERANRAGQRIVRCAAQSEWHTDPTIAARSNLVIPPIRLAGSGTLLRFCEEQAQRERNDANGETLSRPQSDHPWHLIGDRP
jgi:hypothetical protein